MNPSIWGRAVALGSLLLASSWAQALTFAVNEGVTDHVGNDESRARSAAFSGDLSRLLGQPVRVEPIGDYPTLRKGLADKAYDLAIVHPAHIWIGAMKNNGYRLVAVSKGFENCGGAFTVCAGAPSKSLAELRGKKVGAPDEESTTSWMVRAALRDASGDAKAVDHTDTRCQDAVPLMVGNTFTLGGASASNAIDRLWEAGGGKVIARGKPVPVKHVIASPSLRREMVDKLSD